MKNDNHRAGRKWRRRLLAIAGVLCLAGEFAYANPTGPVVANGQVGFSTAGNVLTVTNSPGSIINWQSFSIGSNEVTRFLQQSSASSVLNRVSGINPSTILGALQSNGRVFLINPSGIMFGVNAQIDVAGLVASTLNLSDADFLAGRFRFTDMPGAAGIANQGSITTTAGGMVYLVAPDIQNSGIIKTPQGEILLAAGKSVELVDAQTPEVRVQISAPDNRALNLGQLIAEGGRIGIYAGLIQHGGAANANTAVVGENGKIVFKATNDVTLETGSQTTANGPQGGSVTVQSETGTALVAGNIEAKGEAGRGGNVEILGNKVGLIDHATVDASGQTGGGKVLVGGDYQGKNPGVQNSWRTYFGPDASVKADAIDSGDGGKVILWSDDITRYYGSISARGGAQGGDGGFVEVSGKHTLAFNGSVDTSALKGHTGTLLLDPTDITVINGSGGADDATLLSSTDGTILFADGPASTHISEAALEAVNATTNISLQATNSISIDDLTDNTLGLLQGAGNSVTFQTGAGGFSMNAGDTIQTAGSAINFIVTGGGGATVGGLNAAGGAISLDVAGASSVSGVIAGTGTTLTKLGAGTVVLSNANTYDGGTSVSAGVLNLQNSAAAGTGTVAVTSGAAVQVQGGITVANALTLNGTGVSSDGALRNISGSNTWSGAITDGSASRINSDSGTLTLTGGIDNGTFLLTVGGAGDTTVNTVAIGGTGGLTKDGAGTLTLGSANTYTGLTTVSAGTLAYGTNDVISTGAVTVDGATAVLDLGANQSDTVGTVTVATGGSITGTGTSTLTSTGSFEMQDGSVSAILAGSGIGLNKTTSGTVTLSGANAYTGATTINAGTLSVATIGDGGVAGNLGQATNAAGNLVLGGGTLQYTGATASTDRAFTLTNGTTSLIDVTSNNLTMSGASAATTGALTKIGSGTLTLSGTNLYTGATMINAGTLKLGGGAALADGGAVSLADVAGVTLDLNGANETIGSLAGGGTTGGIVTNGVGAGSTLTTGDATNTTFSGVIQDGAGTVALTKQGGGIFTLAGANTYTGVTTINAGTLSVATIGNGGVAGNLGAATNAAANLVLAGGTLQYTGAAASTDRLFTLTSNGGTIDASGAGALNLTNTGSVAFSGSGARTLTLAGTNTGNNTLAAVLGDGAGAATSLTKSAAGTWVLSGTNTYTGSTTISAGTLALGANDVLANTSTLAVGGGVFDLGAFSDTVGGVQLTAGTIQNGTLTSATDYDVQAGAVSAVLAGTVGLNKSGSGTVALSSANTYTGPTTISAGTLAVSGAGGTAGTGTIAVGANTLNIVNGATITNAVTIDGGTITNSAGAGTLSTGGVTLGGNSNVGSTASGLTISAAITGGFGLATTGTGTVTLGGVNTYTGATTINGGSTLALDTTGTIADSSGVANSGTFTIAADKTIDSMTGAGATTLGGSTLTIGDASNTSGTYSGVVSGTGGIATAGTGTLTLGGANLYTGATTIGSGSTLALNATGTIAASAGVANSGTFTIAADKTIDSMTGAGATTLGGNTLTIGDASNTSGTYSGVVSGTGGITKAGAGTLTLAGANNYSGTTTISAGVLNLQNDTAAGTGTVAVTSGAGVQVQGGITVANALTLNGTGVSNDGALRNISSDNIWSGAITDGSASRINSDSGMLTLTGGIDNGGALLTVGGAGATTVNTAAISGAGGLTKDGSGTLTLGFANAYGGTTTISAGTLTAVANNALGSTAGNTTVASGATIGFSNNVIYSGTETIVLNGTGATGRAGALDNISGTNSFAGTLTLVGGGNSTIGATAGSFTHSGSTVGASDLTYNLASGTTITESGVVSGVGTNAIKNGAGTLVLSGSNTYTGATTLNAGTLRATTSAAALGAGTLTLAGGTLELANDSGLNFGRDTTVTGNSTIVSDRLTSGAGVTQTLGTLSIGAQTLAVNAGANVTGGTAGLTFGTATLTGGATFSVGSGALLTLGNVSGAGQALTVDGAGSTNFSGTVGAASVALNNTAGTISFQDNATITTGLTTAANAFNVSFTGNNNNIAGTTAFNNTGTLTLGDQNTDSTTFAGGVTATAPAGKSIAGTIAATTGASAIDLGTTAVTVTDNTAVGGAATGPITLGNATIADGKSLTMGTGIANAINLGSVLGNGGAGTESLTINTMGVANIAGAVGATGNALDQLTITQSGGATFASTVDAKNVTTTDTAASQTVAFQNGVTATNLTVGSGTGAYNVSLLGSGDVITNAVTFNNTGTLTLGQAGGTQTYNGGITATAPSSTTLKGTIATSDDALVFGPVTLGANTVLNSGTGAVSFGGTVDADLAGNNRTLAINSTGTTVLGGVVGGAQALASLTTNAGGTTQINGGAVTTMGGQTYNDAVTLGANTTLTGANVAFNNTLNSSGTNRTLAVNDSGTTTFGGAVGGILALSSVTTDAAGATAINGGSVTTTGAQTYNDAVTFNADATLTSTVNGNIGFAATLNSFNATARSLTVNSGGVTTFGGTVGGTNALASLTADAGGTTQINGGAVTTTGGQTYNDAVTLGADTTFNGVNIAFNNTLNSSGTNRTLTVNDSGTTTFGGVVGGALALASITTDAPGAAAVNGGSVTTTGGQTYNDAVTLGANTTFNGVNIAFNNTLNSSGTSRTLTVNDSGTTTFGGAVGGSLALTSLATDAGGATAINAGSLTTTGTQTYNDAVIVGANSALNAGSANVTFASTVNGPAGLTVNSTGATTFNATAGGITPLASVATDAGGTTSLQDVTTTGAQSYGDNVVLKSIYNTGNGAFSVGGTTAFSVASTAINTGSGDITFTGPINGANNLTLTNTGITTFSSPVGGTTPLTTLTATAGNFVMPVSVTTTGNITMTGAGSYSVPSITTTSGGNVALTSTGGALSVNAASAAAGGDVTLTADEIELTGAANSIIGSVNLRLQPQNVSQAIEIGGLGGTGALDITNNEITKIATGFPNITIGQTAGTGAVSFNTSSFNDHLTVIGGSIAANGALTAAGKTITLTANSGGISSSTGAGVNVVANALNANAVGNITLNTRVDTINAASSAGGITLVEADGATLANVTAPAGDVDITATTGNLALDTVTAGTTNNKFALLFAPNGTITDANGSAVNVTAANIELVARDGIDLDTKAFNSDFTIANFPALQPSRLNAGTITAVNTGIADIDIRQVGNADILNVATASDQTTSGNITISGTDSLAVNTVSAGGLVYFGTAPSITTKSVGGNMLITLNSPRASAGLSDPTVTLAGGGLVPVNDTGRDGGPGKVAMIERFVAPSGADDYRVTGTGTDNRFTLVVAGQVPVVGGTIKITAPGAITDYTGMPPDTSEVINVLNLVGQTIEVSGFTSSLAYQLVTDGSGLEGFSPEQTLPASVAQLVQQIAASQRSTQDKEEKKKQDASAGGVCR